MNPESGGTLRRAPEKDLMSRGSNLPPPPLALLHICLRSSCPSITLVRHSQTQLWKGEG
jgi:hypothetical protein